jgi:N-methylhydantoinase B
MAALFDRYGADVVQATFESIFQRSEALAREAVKQIPDGEYVAETSMDDDGVEIGRPVPIKVRVIVRGDQMTIDLSGLSPQVAGYFNSGDTAGRSAAQVAFKCLTSPQEFPINVGAFRPVDIVLPAGTVVSATKPAAMRWWMTYPMTIVDSVFRAVAEAVPGGSIAGHHADLAVSTVYGVNSLTGRFALFLAGIQGGGWGATRSKDGENATICINDGDTHNAPVEAQEAKYGFVHALEYALREDSGGAGTKRGGLGTVQKWVSRQTLNLDSFVERTVVPPWGVECGGPGLPNRVSIQRSADEGPTRFSNGKLDGVTLEEGDTLIVETGGGGGYGDPFLRSAELVLSDVVAGYVSVDAAKDDYGVLIALAPDGVSHSIVGTTASRDAAR